MVDGAMPKPGTLSLMIPYLKGIGTGREGGRLNILLSLPIIGLKAQWNFRQITETVK